MMRNPCLQGLDYYKPESSVRPLYQADNDSGDTSTIRPRSR